jgi:hypothetical protein
VSVGSVDTVASPLARMQECFFPDLSVMKLT